MTSQRLGFLQALGQEFSQSLADTVGWENITPQDGYEVFLRVFKQEPTSQLLAKITNPELETLLAVCWAYFENESITSDLVRTAINRTLARYPVESTA
jgi:hypothetical protein